MKISHIEHLGIAVKSIEEALPYYYILNCWNPLRPKVLLQSSLRRTMEMAVCIT